MRRDPIVDWSGWGGLVRILFPVILLVLVALGLYSQVSNVREAERACTASGGTWYPTIGGSGTCIWPKGEQR